MNYEVTIGVPIYNVEKHIRLMLDSVMAQTFESIEFIMLDDCGTDSSIDIVREYQQNHPRGKDIRIVRQPQNMGVGHGRNRIIDEAQGRYLYFMDADDAIAPDTIELLYANAQKYNAQIVYGSHERIEEFGGEDKHKLFQYPAMQFLEEDAFPTYVYRKYEGIQAMTWNILIDINVCRANNLRFQPVNYWEDFSFTFDLPTYITRAVLLPDITYYYYCRYGSQSNYRKRSHIDKEELVKTICAINQNKDKSDRIRHKPYFSQRTYKLLKTDFYIVCTIFRDEKILNSAFTNREIRDIMKSPLTLREILSFRQLRMRHLSFYLLSVFPPALSVALMRLAAKKCRMV